MDKYFLTTITLIIFSIIFIMYVRLSARILKDDSNESKPVVGDDDSACYDSVSKSKFITNDPLAHLKSSNASNYLNPSDFTLLE